MVDELEEIEPSIQQQAIIEWLLDGGGNLMIEALAGSGKCLGRGTPVLKYDLSIVPVEDIKSGDLLMGPDSLPRRVLSTSAGTGPLYKITPVKGEPWVCNDVHVLTLKGTNYLNGVVRDISLSEMLDRRDSYGRMDKQWKLFRVPLEFGPEAVPFDPYMVGTWLGDGTVGSWQWTLGVEKEPLVKYLEQQAKTISVSFNLRWDERTNSWNVRFGMRPHRFSGMGFTKYQRFVLKDKFMDLVYTESGQKTIPHCYLRNSRQVRMAVLAGLLDTDGSQGYGGFEITTRYESLRDDVLLLARSLGFSAYYSVKKVKLDSWREPRDYYRMWISGDSSELPLLRHVQQARLQVKDVLKTGWDAQPIGRGEYFGFTLDRDGRFLLGDLTVTHNTSTLLMLLPYMAGTAFLGAFNVAIKNELASRIQGLNLIACKAVCKTIHSAGLSALCTGKPKEQWPAIVENKMPLLLDELFAKTKDDDFSTYDQFLINLVGFAKRAGVAALVDDTEAVWQDLIEYYNVVDDLPDDAFDEDGEVSEKTLARLVRKAQKVYYASIAKGSEEVDFDDMLLLPIYHDLPFRRYDWVLLDEVQDCSAIRQEIAIRMLKPNGRMIAVGDRNQCQPRGTMVWRCAARGNRWGPQQVEEIPIENVRKGDDVISFSLHDSSFRMKRKVRAVSKRKYSGVLVVVDDGSGRVSKYTPDHKCVARFSSLAGKHVTYLMKKGDRFRVGTAPMFYKNGSISCGPVARMMAEKADCVWILGIHPDTKSAMMEESILSANYNIPELMFTPKNGSHWTQEEFDGVWSSILPNIDGARRCLRAFGREYQYPFASSGRNNTITGNSKSAFNTARRLGIVRACNLLDGCLVSTYPKSGLGTVHLKREERESIVSVKRERYTGMVYSLDVDGEHLYVADGIVTHNCIYGFSGVAHDDLDKLAKRMQMKVLPLSVTYRCPRSVVSIANTWVPELRAADDAHSGTVRTIQMEPEACMRCCGLGKEESKRVGQVAADCRLCGGTGKSGPGFWSEVERLDADTVIICRNNQPIVELAYRLISKGVPCQIEGRDFASSLVKLCHRWRVRELDKLEERLVNYRGVESKRWRDRGNDQRAASVEDKVDTLLSLLREVKESGKTRVIDLTSKINMMFGDTKDGEAPRVLTLSTVHKAKGKEWDKVYILGRNRYMPSRWARKPHEVQAEQNIMYVAVTRAMKELVDIEVDGGRRKK